MKRVIGILLLAVLAAGCTTSQDPEAIAQNDAVMRQFLGGYFAFRIEPESVECEAVSVVGIGRPVRSLAWQPAQSPFRDTGHNAARVSSPSRWQLKHALSARSLSVFCSPLVRSVMRASSAFTNASWCSL